MKKDSCVPRPKANVKNTANAEFFVKVCLCNLEENPFRGEHAGSLVPLDWHLLMGSWRGVDGSSVVVTLLVSS